MTSLNPGYSYPDTYFLAILDSHTVKTHPLVPRIVYDFVPRIGDDFVPRICDDFVPRILKGRRRAV